MKKITWSALIFSSMLLTGCISIESINKKILPVNQWYEQEYEATRFTQRYKFTKTDIEVVRRGIVNSSEKFGMTISSSTDDIVATGNPTTMFSEVQCESWKRADEEKTKQLSAGIIVLKCDSSNKNSLIVATIKLKAFPSGTLVVLDYEMMNPKMDAYGFKGPRRPPPTASKNGSTKFWEAVNGSLPYPVLEATKEDLQ